MDTCDLHMYEPFSKMLKPCLNQSRCNNNFFPIHKLKVMNDVTKSQPISTLKIRPRYYLCAFSQHVISQCPWYFLDTIPFMVFLLSLPVHVPCLLNMSKRSNEIWIWNRCGFSFVGRQSRNMNKLCIFLPCKSEMYWYRVR